MNCKNELKCIQRAQSYQKSCFEMTLFLHPFKPLKTREHLQSYIPGLALGQGRDALSYRSAPGGLIF